MQTVWGQELLQKYNIGFSLVVGGLGVCRHLKDPTKNRTLHRGLDAILFCCRLHRQLFKNSAIPRPCRDGTAKDPANCRGLTNKANIVDNNACAEKLNARKENLTVDKAAETGDNSFNGLGKHPARSKVFQNR